MGPTIYKLIYCLVTIIAMLVAPDFQIAEIGS